MGVIMKKIKIISLLLSASFTLSYCVSVRAQTDSSPNAGFNINGIETFTEDSIEANASENSKIKSEIYEGTTYYLEDGNLYKGAIHPGNQIFKEFYIENIIISDNALLATVLDQNIEYLDISNNDIVYCQKGEAELAALSNEQIVFNYLINNMGLNSAAACGVLSNIKSESSFRPNALGDNDTSYGICQWHNSRWTNLKNYCNNNDYDWTSLDGQLHYLEYELEASYPAVWNKLHSVSNTADGAYNAGWYWCYYFEIPANRASVSVTRGNYAKNTYWPIYGNNNPGNSPDGCVDSYSGGSGKVTVSGWTFDLSDVSQALEIHVYIGGPADSPNAEGHPGIIANTYRSDVNNAYGCGDYHGFSASINTNKTGVQEVYVYAINIGDGDNAELGHATVEIMPRITKLDAWVSDTKMGEKVTALDSDQMYYLCYKIYDGNSEEYSNSYSRSSYTVTETVYDASGNKIYSNPYTKSDNNWIGFTPGTGGSWRGEVSVSGDISGVLTISFDVIKRDPSIDIWLSKSAMGSKVSTRMINGTEHYNCDLDEQYYMCYKIYDKNSGELLNSYTDANYTMTLVFYDKNNKEIGRRQFDNDDNDCIDFITSETGICSCKATLSGNVSREATAYMYISEGVVSVTGISLNKSSVSLNKGESQQLTATVLPSNAANKAVTWSSSNTSVAAVSSGGLVTAKTSGTAVITAKTADGSKTAACTVYVTESAVSGDPYIINSIALKSIVGKALTKAPVNSKFVVTADFTKVQTKNTSDSIMIAVYDYYGRLLHFDSEKISVAKDEINKLNFTIPAQSKTIGGIKVYIWDNSMKPLAEAAVI